LSLFLPVLFISFVQAERDGPEIYDTIDGDAIYRFVLPTLISAVLNPQYVSGADADQQMLNAEPIIGLMIEERVMAYSPWQLDNHKIVNDAMSGISITGNLVTSLP